VTTLIIFFKSKRRRILKRKTILPLPNTTAGACIKTGGGAMSKSTEQNNLEFEVMQLKAKRHGFQIEHFTGYELIEIETGCDLYFITLDDVNNYIDACDLNEFELQKRYNFPLDSDLAE
jgi:hypothetical protein